MSKLQMIITVTTALIIGLFGGLFLKTNVLTKPVFAKSTSPVVLKWEPIEHAYGSGMDRAKIPGGWIVRSGRGSSIVFVPDPEHKWK